MAKSNEALSIGIDLGGTNIGAGVVDRGGKVLGYDRVKTKAEQGADAVIDRIVKSVEKACEEASVKTSDIACLGIGAPGTCNLHTGVVHHAANLRWTDFPLGPKLSKALGVDVVVDNDVNVGAWGEYRAGAGKGGQFQDMMAVFVGTGIGGGLVLNDQLYHGHSMTAGEIGQTVIHAYDVRGRNTLEQCAGRKSIVSQLTRLVEQHYPSSLSEDLLEPNARIGSKKLKAAFESGDALTVEIIEYAAHCVGVSVANQVTMLSLPLVVVGGGVTEALGEAWIKLITDSFKRVVHPPYLKDCQIVAAELEDLSGVVGAALLAQERLLS